jgi:hypothetical protein
VRPHSNPPAMNRDAVFGERVHGSPDTEGAFVRQEISRLSSHTQRLFREAAVVDLHGP